MPSALSLFLLLLPTLAVCQTSRVQGFSVFRDQRESYILEVPPCPSVSPSAVLSHAMLTTLIFMQPFCFLPEGVLRARVSDISFYDPRGEGSDNDKTMDFPLALMKTAQAVVQDGHKLFRLGRIAAAT
jgi:hypothetical protein